MVSPVRDFEADMTILIKEIATKAEAIDRMRNFLSTFLCMSLLLELLSKSDNRHISGADADHLIHPLTPLSTKGGKVKGRLNLESRIWDMVEKTPLPYLPFGLEANDTGPRDSATRIYVGIGIILLNVRIAIARSRTDIDYLC